MTAEELSRRQQTARIVIVSQEFEGMPMDVRMRQVLEAFAQGKISVDDLLELVRRCTEGTGHSNPTVRNRGSV